MTTGERMKMRRKELGLSAEQVAEALALSPATIYRYEKGDIEKVPGDLLEPISRVLSTTPTFLMGWESFSDPITQDIQANTQALTLSKQEEDFVLAYRQASADDRAIVDLALRKYIKSEKQKTASAG